MDGVRAHAEVISPDGLVRKFGVSVMLVIALMRKEVDDVRVMPITGISDISGRNRDGHVAPCYFFPVTGEVPAAGWVGCGAVCGNVDG